MSGLGDGDVPRSKHGNDNSLESGLKNGLTGGLAFLFFNLFLEASIMTAFGKVD